MLLEMPEMRLFFSDWADGLPSPGLALLCLFSFFLDTGFPFFIWKLLLRSLGPLLCFLSFAIFYPGHRSMLKLI